MLVILAVDGRCALADDSVPQPATQPATPSETQPECPPFDVTGVQYIFTPGVWMPRVSGTVSLGSSSNADDIELRNDLKLDNSEPTFTGEFTIRKDQEYQVKFGGFAYSTDTHSTFEGAADFGNLSFNPGDEFRASFDMTSVNVEAAYWFPAVRSRKLHTQLLLGVDAGFRYIDVDQTVEIIGEGKIDTGGEWVAPYAGVELELRWPCIETLKILQQVQIAGGFALGPALGGDDGVLVQLHADITFMFTDNFGAFFGYKLVNVFAQNGDYDLEGGVEGLYFGATIRF